MSATITKEQRDVLYHSAMLDLSAVGDIHVNRLNGNDARARELSQRFRVTMRLVDDLGWVEEDERDAYVLTMEGADLAAAMQRLLTEVEDELEEISGYVAAGKESTCDRGQMDQDLEVIVACRSVLEQLKAVA